MGFEFYSDMDEGEYFKEEGSSDVFLVTSSTPECVTAEDYETGVETKYYPTDKLLPVPYTIDPPDPLTFGVWPKPVHDW